MRRVARRRFRAIGRLVFVLFHSTEIQEKNGFRPPRDIAYCRIGERSSHTWFVLKYLLGYPEVRNYDGFWTEWGNLVRTPIENL